MPQRRFKKGPKPKIQGAEAKGGKHLEEEEEGQWIYNKREPTQAEKKKLISAAVEISIKASFKNHIYCFGGKVYKQLKGGPIGSRLTMAVARVVMAIFGRLVRQSLLTASIEIFFDTVYVDDLRYILSIISMYMEWDKRSKSWKDRRFQEPSKQETTSRRIKTVTWNSQKSRWESATVPGDEGDSDLDAQMMKRQLDPGQRRRRWLLSRRRKCTQSPSSKHV